MKTNLEHYGEPASCSNAAGLALLEQCQNSGLGCGDCRLRNPSDPITKPCRENWDVAPYGMPLDKRIEWYEEHTSQKCESCWGCDLANSVFKIICAPVSLRHGCFDA